uniref:PH domain-containing protein n=3 Tax=Chenopodium quinoa TaxID=63459 RepID=A0A803LWJ3_CHEQI
MGDGPRTIEIIPDYFEASASASADSPLPRSSDTSVSGEDSPHTSTSGTTSHLDRHSFFSNTTVNSASSIVQNRSFSRNKLKTASFMLRLFSLKGLRNITGLNGEEKVELSAVELESLRSELADVEEREAHFKAQLEHLDEILRRARLSGYLNMRTRWAALPGELPPIDDCDVDDWVPRFTVLQGSCIFFYLSSTDLSPQDSALLSDIDEVGSLPCIVREGEEIWHCFYIVTRYGLRIECSSDSEIQVDSWLRALRTECKLGPDKTDPGDQNCESNVQQCI